MSDVVSSSNYVEEILRKELHKLVTETNTSFKQHILSPLTITLGDEFQRILKSTASGNNLIFHMEESLLKRELDFKLHYVILLGEIETEINPKIAYEMLGKVLADARKLLSSKKRNRKRFKFRLNDREQSERFSKLFKVLDAIILNWKKRITL